MRYFYHVTRKELNYSNLKASIGFNSDAL